MAFARRSINATVFAVAALAGAGLATVLLGSKEPVDDGQRATAVTGKAAREESPAQLPPVRPRATVGAAANESAADVGDSAGDTIPETRLPLRLVGTLVTTPAQLSQAIIVDVEELRHMVLREGDALELHPDVKLHEIGRRRVLLATERGLEELRLARDEGLPEVAANRETTITTAVATAERERPLRSTAELRRNRSANVRPEVIDAMNQLVAHLANDLEPLYDSSGRIEGVRAVSIARDGFLERAGIGRDEVIRGVNGIEITTPEGASRVLRDLASCEPAVGMVAGPMGGREVEIDVALLKQFGCVETR